MYRVWHVDKYKITFKLVISHWTDKILQHIVVSSGLSRPGIIDARARYRAAARRLRNTDLSYLKIIFTFLTNLSSKTGGARNEGIPMLITFHFDSSKYYPLPLTVGL